MTLDAAEHFRRYWGAICEDLGGVHERGPIERLRCHRGGWPLNGVLRFEGSPDDAEAELARLLGEGRPFVWYLEPDGPGHLPPSLEAAGCERLPGFSTIDAPMPAEVPRPPPTAQVSLAEGEAVVAAAEVQMVAHDIPPFARDEFVADSQTFAERDDAVVAVALSEGRVVSMARALVVDDTVGLYGAATLPDARRRGLGRAVSLELIRWGQERGCRRIVGATTDDGLALAQAMGGVAAGRIDQYRWFPPGGGPPPG